MPREQWAWLVDPLMEAMRGFDFNGRRLDVRENIAFQGKGEQTRFVHDRYPGPRLRDRARVQEVLHGRMERQARPGTRSRRCASSSPTSRPPPRHAGAMNRRATPDSDDAVRARVRQARRASPDGRQERPRPSRPLAAVHRPAPRADDRRAASRGGSRSTAPPISSGRPRMIGPRAGVRGGRRGDCASGSAHVLVVSRGSPLGAGARRLAEAAAVRHPDRRRRRRGARQRALDCLAEALARSRSTCGKVDASRSAMRPSAVDRSRQRSASIGCRWAPANPPRDETAHSIRSCPAISRSRSAMRCCRRPALSWPTASARRPAHFRSLGPERLPRRRAGRRQEARQSRAELRLPAVRLADQQPRGDGALLRRRRREAPKFRYRPLTVDPDAAKRDLYAVDLSHRSRTRCSSACCRKSGRRSITS